MFNDVCSKSTYYLLQASGGREYAPVSKHVSVCLSMTANRNGLLRTKLAPGAGAAAGAGAGAVPLSPSTMVARTRRACTSPPHNLVTPSERRAPLTSLVVRMENLGIATRRALTTRPARSMCVMMSLGNSLTMCGTVSLVRGSSASRE